MPNSTAIATISSKQKNLAANVTTSGYFESTEYCVPSNEIISVQFPFAGTEKMSAAGQMKLETRVPKRRGEKNATI